MDGFEFDDRAAAEERMAEIDAAAALDLVQPNDAVIVSGVVNLFALTGRHEQFVDRFSDDFEGRLLDGRTITKADVASGAITPADLGFGVTERELFAVDGDEVAVFDTDDDGVAARTIELLDDNQRLRGVWRFGADESAIAQDAFRRHSSTTLSSALRRFGAALITRTFDPGILSDDFEMIDRRPLGLGSPDRDSYLASIDAVINMGGFVWRRAYVRRTDNANLSFIRTEYPDQGGGLDFVEVLTLMTADGGRVNRIEHFEVASIDAAIARFDAVTDGVRHHEQQRARTASAGGL